MKKLFLALPALLILVSFSACTQAKKWTDKERTELREIVRAHKEKTMLKHMEKNDFANLENCVVTTIEGTYPDYNKYDQLTGKTDTLVAVMVDCTADMLGSSYENLPLIFPYPQLQSVGILPADLTADQLTAFYSNLTAKIKASYPQPADFAEALCVDPTMPNVLIDMMQQCASDLQNASAPATTPAKK